MNEEAYSRVHRELWTFLRSLGFPAGVDDAALKLATSTVDSRTCAGKRVKLRGWSWREGGLHDDDVAIVMLLAASLGLREGLDWDWGLEIDKYHFEVAYIENVRIDTLLKPVDLYHQASLVALTPCSARNGVDDGELQAAFRKESGRRGAEWKRRP